MSSREKPSKEKSSKSSASKVTTPERLALRGSSKLVSEFFEYSINSILYQRGVYPSDDFITVKKYGLPMLMASDDQVKAYIRKIMVQLHKWMLKGKLSRLVVVITDKETGEHVERWQFNVDLVAPTAVPASKKSSKGMTASKGTDDGENADPTGSTATASQPEKNDQEIHAEISHLFRQITSSVTFLPLLSNPCTFNVLVYADADSEVPVEWGDSDAKEIEDGEKVELRTFSTTSHRIGTTVSYRLGD